MYHARCPQSPQTLVFHPFEPHLAVALKDCFGYLNFPRVVKSVLDIWKNNNEACMNDICEKFFQSMGLSERHKVDFLRKSRKQNEIAHHGTRVYQFSRFESADGRFR